jgi:hypothetical protein
MHQNFQQNGPDCFKKIVAYLQKECPFLCIEIISKKILIFYCEIFSKAILFIII